MGVLMYFLRFSVSVDRREYLKKKKELRGIGKYGSS